MAGMLAALLMPALALSQEPGWRTLHLSHEFTCEGASFGDLNGDGVHDVVAGPFWWEGPEYRVRRRYYDGKAYDSNGYSDHFHSWVTDADGDGDQDVLVASFPGQFTWWFENPGGGEGEAWARHTVHDVVDNESPHLVDLTGDGRKELVCHSGGVLCWLDPGEDPRAPWVRHDLSGPLGLGRFTHGLGVGDVTGDGRPDVLLNSGVWVQPESLEGDPRWEYIPFLFSRGQGGAQMLVTDVDGDGDSDVVTSLNAHRYGLSWFESRPGEEVPFVEHPIMGATPGEHGCRVAVSELHALALADVNGDGLPDVITGKRYKSHGFGEPGSRDPVYLLWFELVREEDGARYEAHLIHGHAGVGTQVMAGDVDGDGHVDVVVGNKLGAFLHLQREDGARPALPDVPAEDEGAFPAGGVVPVGLDGQPLNVDFETGDLRHWKAEGGAFADQPIRDDTVLPRRGDMTSDHVGAFWIGGFERHQDKPTGTLTSDPFVLTEPFMAFLIAGGAMLETRVEVLDAGSGRPLAAVVGRNHEALRPTVLDLSAHLGTRVRVRLVDDHAGGWGHLNFDHLRLYAERPTFPEGLEVSARAEERLFFDGKTLRGWTGDPALWSVEDGEFVGRTEGLARNAFLVSDLELADFRLLLEVKLSPNSENSGVQFRSRPRADGSVEGYQADIGASWWGNLYDEHGRGLLVNAQGRQQARPGEWNRYEIVAVGDRVLTAINGVLCVDYTETEEDRRRGQVALQIHSGGAMEVRFRVLGLELDPAPELRTVGEGR